MTQPTEDTEIGLESLFNRQQLIPVLREEFEDIANTYPDENDRDFVLDALIQIYLHKQAEASTLVGILCPKHGEPQQIADKLLKVVEHDFIDFNMNIGENGVFVTKYNISDDVKAMLERYQYPLPMVIPPKKVKNNTETGYYTITGLLVLNGNEWFIGKDICRDHINTVNRTALSINEKVLNSPEGVFKKPVRKPGEDFKEFQHRFKQADVFYNTSLQVMSVITDISDEFYLTHKYDRRGRCYASGYHINTQGDDYRKAVIQFSKKEKVNGT